MSVTDVQRAFVRGLEGKASCKAAMLDYEDGGRMQRLSFHVVSGSYGAAYLSEVIPSDLCPMQHARTMAANFLEGRIAGQSQFTALPQYAPPLGAAVLPPAPVPLHQVAALPPANDQAPAVAPLLPSRAPTVVVAQAPEASGPQGLTDDMAAL